LDAGHFVQVLVPVMHALQTRARRVDLSPQPQCTIKRCLHDLAPGKGYSPLRLLNGLVKQLQTNNPWQIFCNTRLAHTWHPCVSGVEKFTSDNIFQNMGKFRNKSL